jgi:hypothetical protein
MTSVVTGSKVLDAPAASVTLNVATVVEPSFKVSTVSLAFNVALLNGVVMATLSESFKSRSCGVPLVVFARSTLLTPVP